MAEKKFEAPKYEYPIYGINWTAGIGRPTGIYWLAGESVFAVHGTVAEDIVIAAGGILIATLRFDADPLERTHAGRAVDRVAAHFVVGTVTSC